MIPPWFKFYKIIIHNLLRIGELNFLNKLNSEIIMWRKKKETGSQLRASFSSD